MKNNSKQTVLSIVGIAILVIAVVGVSFAFFTYTKNGTTNNVITTGSITFAYEETSSSALTLSNRFPQTVAEGTAASTPSFQFNVHGTLPSTANDVTYNVYIVPGDTQAGKTRFRDTEISVKLTATNNAQIVTGYETGAPLTNAVGSYQAGTANKGLKVATGTIAADGTAHQDDYTLKMWVNDSVSISDTDGTKTYRAKTYDGTNWPEGSSSDTRAVYSNLYYSIKVNVDAND